jgi:hypothetical protein
VDEWETKHQLTSWVVHWADNADDESDNSANRPRVACAQSTIDRSILALELDDE